MKILSKRNLLTYCLVAQYSRFRFVSIFTFSPRILNISPFFVLKGFMKCQSLGINPIHLDKGVTKVQPNTPIVP